MIKRLFIFVKAIKRFFNMSITQVEMVRAEQGLTKKAFSQAIGVSEQSYNNYFKGKRDVPLSVLLEIKQMFNVSLDWLVTGEKKISSSEIVAESDVVHVAEYDISLSAGNGFYPNGHPLVVEERPFSRKWLQAKGLKPEHLVLTRISGESMEPLLKDKDIVMIDRSQLVPNDASPFAVRIDDALYIKRVYKQGNVLRLISTNPIYTPIDVDLGIVDCEILGAVVWHAHSWI